MNRKLILSWKAAALAPLAVPFIACALFQIFSPGQKPLVGFLVLFGLGSSVSLAATIFLLIPCLYMVTRFVQLTVSLTGLIGAILGGMVWLPVAWQSYCASGFNSGPPQETFYTYLTGQSPWPELWFFMASGMVTALLYRRLSLRWA